MATDIDKGYIHTELNVDKHNTIGDEIDQQRDVFPTIYMLYSEYISTLFRHLKTNYIATLMGRL